MVFDYPSSESRDQKLLVDNHDDVVMHLFFLITSHDDRVVTDDCNGQVFFFSNVVYGS
jgi:hypothetical protein